METNSTSGGPSGEHPLNALTDAEIDRLLEGLRKLADPETGELLIGNPEGEQQGRIDAGGEAPDDPNV